VGLQRSGGVYFHRRSLDRGQGLVYYEADAAFRPITIEPPFYPIALSVIGLFKVNLVVAARWLNIMAFIASIFIAAGSSTGTVAPRPWELWQRVDVRLPLYGVDVRSAYSERCSS